MPTSFPLSTADFLDQLPIASCSFELPEVVEMSRTAGGDLQTDSMGTRLWTGRVTLGRLTRREAMEAKALIDVVRGAGGSFMVYHTAYANPYLYPGGSVLQNVTPTIFQLYADSRLIRLTGLPVGFRLSRGDYLAFSYRSDPIRYALHRVQDSSAVAQGDGTTPAFEVVPNIRPGAVAGTVVQLIKAACKAQILPDTVEPGETTRFMTTGIAFDFLQTLR